MPENQKEIEIRSDEVQEIMSHVPHWMIRWGITLMFILLLIFLFVSWLIKYPDVIKGTIEITTEVPPVKLVNKNSGELDSIYYEENTFVNKGDIIAILNNTLSVKAKTQLDSIHAEIQRNFIQGNLTTVELGDPVYPFGTLQSDYNNLVKLISEYQSLLDERNLTFKIDNLQDQIHNHEILKSVTYQQLNTAKSQLVKAEEKLSSDRVLFENEVISKMEFYDKEKLYFTAKDKVDNLKKSSVQHSITISNLKKELNQIELDFNQKKQILEMEIQSALFSIENTLNHWSMDYQIIAPVDGMLTYINQIKENQYIASGKELFAIIPENQQYIGYMKIPQTGYGKVEAGQSVRIKLDNFPFHEYGQVNGTVQEISLIPNENSYLITIKLPKGLRSSYNKSLKFTPEMSGSAEIITQDLRLIERIFNKFRNIFNQ